MFLPALQNKLIYVVINADFATTLLIGVILSLKGCYDEDYSNSFKHKGKPKVWGYSIISHSGV